jgi:hypothetical protein
VRKASANSASNWASPRGFDHRAEGASECLGQSQHLEANAFYISGLAGKSDSRSNSEEESLHHHGGLVGPAAVNGCLRYARFGRDGFNRNSAKTVLLKVLEDGIDDRSFDFVRTKAFHRPSILLDTFRHPTPGLPAKIGMQGSIARSYRCYDTVRSFIKKCQFVIDVPVADCSDFKRGRCYRLPKRSKLAVDVRLDLPYGMCPIRISVEKDEYILRRRKDIQTLEYRKICEKAVMNTSSMTS